MNTYDLYISQVYRGPDENKIIISCTTDLDETILLLWDCKENREIRNYSLKGSHHYLTGRGSESGYIFNEDRYVNMDQIISNYFFDVNFSEHFVEDNLSNGYKVSKKEDILLCSGVIMLKVTYIDSQTIDNLVSHKELITEENIYLERIKFQIDGNTILHLFALKFQVLSIILNYLEEHKKEYLTMILMKNKHQISPLDITIENDSPKCTELLLSKLCLLNEGTYSSLLYQKFPKLLSMNLKTFYDYLES